jgi:hypothetical protein
MEGYLVVVAATLLQTTPEKAGVILYNINSFHTWLTIIDNLLLADNRTEPARTEWARISKALKQLNDTRVRLAHHHVDKLSDESEPFLKPNPLDLRVKSIRQSPLTIHDLATFPEKVTDLAERLIKLSQTLKDALGPSPETHPLPQADPPQEDAQ